MNSPTIAVLTIGDELLNGELADTNTQRIARQLGDVGLSLREVATVPDDEDAIAAALLRLTAGYDALIVTGGLGPTADDLTARAAANAFERPLTLNDDALRRVRDFFVRRERPMHPRNEKQALLPRKSEVIPNPTGTAPGFWLQHNGCRCFFLPGVPSEMTVMLTASVLPVIEDAVGLPLLLKRLHIFGLPEPEVEERLDALSLPASVRVAFGVEYPLVTIKLKADGAQADALVAAAATLRVAFGEYLVAVDDETLPGVVGKALIAAEKTLALAESCTGGLIAKLLTDLPGASAFLERGAVTYANAAKHHWLGVSQRILEGEGAVSEACARDMAHGIRQQARTDLGLAVTGIAGPDGGTDGKPVGTVFIALATAEGETVRRYLFHGDRAQVRLMTAMMALEWLRRYLSLSATIIGAAQTDRIDQG
ncbi:MAG: CinA family nicotinamide mononucleotide deamidase-related protein [Desulfuromonadales bacterium]|nr:CinA family nicotinamide mononucleotide deamidase-related protein [Desulfuromonadales bacterium]